MKKILFFLFLSVNAFANKTSDLQKAQKMMQKSSWAFEENKGQVTGADGKNVKFVFKDGNLSMFLMQSGIAYQFNKVTYPEGYKPLDKFASAEERIKIERLQSQIQTETYRMDVNLEGANPNPTIKTEGRSDDYIQYYNHNALDVRSYQKVTYYEVYPNIDWVVYVNKNAGANEPKVKYDFVVHPGGDPSKIKLKTEWVEELKTNADGSITLNNRMGSVTEQRPVSFQDGKDVKTNFVVNNNMISFQLEKFDNETDLIIDPNLIWGTYYGGAGMEYVGYFASKGHQIVAVDKSGNVYLAGETTSSTEISLGGYQNKYSGNWDAFLVKFNSAGIRQWATYYGGDSIETRIFCNVDETENIYLGGLTASTNGIAFNGNQNAFGGGESDAFLVKFNSDGIRQWATYYGGDTTLSGSGGMDGAYSCAVDKSGNVYLAGVTTSSTGISFNGHQNTYGGNGNAFLAKYNSSGMLQWATYYGNGGGDRGYSCSPDINGNVYLVGQTYSTSGISSGGYQNTSGGGLDAFLVKFNSVGVRQWATYFGGKGNDEGRDCKIDGNGNIYMTGHTSSKSDLATGGFQNTYGGNEDAFLAKYNSSGMLQWATYYGGTGAEAAQSCAVDKNNDVYITGPTSSTSNIASGGYQNIFGGDSANAFLVKFNSAGQLQWATYYGNNGTTYGLSCQVDGSNKVYLAGITSSNNNISKGGHQNIYGGNYDAFLVKFDNSANSSISEKNTNSNINIYPNPSEKLLNIETNEPEEWNAIITDSKGAQINQIQFQKSTQLDINNYAPGVYYIQLTSKEEVLNYKFIKK
jgi:hypothetical protein